MQRANRGLGNHEFLTQYLSNCRLETETRVVLVGPNGASNSYFHDLAFRRLQRAETLKVKYDLVQPITVMEATSGAQSCLSLASTTAPPLLQATHPRIVIKYTQWRCAIGCCSHSQTKWEIKYMPVALETETCGGYSSDASKSRGFLPLLLSFLLYKQTLLLGKTPE